MIEAINFPNIGFLKVKLTNEQIFPIISEIKKIENDFNNSIESNDKLVGNIKKEFHLIDCLDHLTSIMKEYTSFFEKNFQLLSSIQILTEDRPLKITEAWVNFQEKHEFNPVHDHAGVFSFVIWIKIPYKISDEILNSPGYKGKAPVPGHFCFYYTNALGRICHYSIPADESFENVMLIFPSTLNHSVYPFYSSDGYRISVSGNVLFQV